MDALAVAEVFAREMFERGESLHDVRAQLREAERVLGLIKGAETVENARGWARTYFGEETRTA